MIITTLNTLSALTLKCATHVGGGAGMTTCWTLIFLLLVGFVTLAAGTVSLMGKPR